MHNAEIIGMKWLLMDFCKTEKLVSFNRQSLWSSESKSHVLIIFIIVLAFDDPSKVFIHFDGNPQSMPLLWDSRPAIDNSVNQPLIWNHGCR